MITAGNYGNHPMNIEPINWGNIDALDGQLDGKVDNTLLPALKAVVAVESSGNGFIKPGVSKRLVEGHRAWKICVKRGMNPAAIAARGYHDVLYPKWTKKHYIGGIGEVQRMTRLIEAVGEEIALMATSFGLGQVLGENYAACGFESVHDYVSSVDESHDKQLEAMLSFIRTNNLWRHLEGETPNFAAFARGYNGPAYAKNDYDGKMHRAFRAFTQAPQEDFKPALTSRRNGGAALATTGLVLDQAAEYLETATAAAPVVSDVMQQGQVAAITATQIWQDAHALSALAWLFVAAGIGFVMYSWWDDRRKGRT